MKNQKSGILATALAIFAVFTAMVYISCNKDESKSITGDISCLEINCLNGGTCVDGECMCPTGYVGDSCQHSWAAKFIGSYNVSETITWSSNSTVIGADSSYPALIRQSAVPEIFFVDSLIGNHKFNSVTGVVDSTTKSFKFLQNEAVYYSQLIMKGGYGTISAEGNVISGVYARQIKDPMGNSRTDSVAFTMSRRQ